MRSRKGRHPWSDEEIITLSAYLDYYVKKRNEAGAWSTQKILSEIAKHIKSRSLKQIEGKLSALRGGSDAKTTFLDTFKFGTRCLQQLSGELSSRIQDEVKAIEINEQTQFLNTPQTLRSGKQRSVSIEVRQQTPCRTTPRKAPRESLRARRSRRAALRSSLPAPDEQVHDVDRDLSIPSENLSQAIQHDQNPVKKEDPTLVNSRDLSRWNPAQRESKSTTVPARTEVPDSEEDSSEDEPEEAEDEDNPTDTYPTAETLFSTHNPQSCLMREDKKVDNIVKAFQEANSHSFYELLRSLLSENSYFRKLHRRAEEELVTFKNQIRVEKGLELASTQNLAWSNFSNIQSSEETIRKLKERLEIQQCKRQFCDSRQNFLDMKEVQDRLTNLANVMDHLASMKEFDGDFTSPTENRSETLDMLFRRSLGHELHSLSGGPRKINSLSLGHRLPRTILLSLVGAAVCEWVFLDNLPCAALLSTPLLDQYRHHLKSLYDEETLQYIDLAAHGSIIRHEQFCQNHFRLTAARLAERLLELFSSIDTSFEISKQKAHIKTKLENVFFYAVSIKYGLVACKDKFSVIWPHPGSAADEFYMDAFPPSLAGTTEGRGANIASKVQVTIVPGLQRHPNIRKLGDYTPFLATGEPAVGGSERISRARVSLQ